MARLLSVSALLVLGCVALTHHHLLAGQRQSPAASRLPQSHVVGGDGSITFRYKDTGAKQVVVNTDASLKPLEMTRSEDGMWTATAGPLPPEIYGYTFVVDGVPTLDPHNGEVRHNLAAPTDEVHVYSSSAPWELSSIPHGSVTRHVFTTHVARGLPQDQSAYIVYTPPGYDPRRKGGYPVLYLLHGYTDAEDGWTSVGRAHLIVDSLIAGGKAVPMIVVMPLGYGNWDFLSGGFGNWSDAGKVEDNVSLFSQTLLTEIMPQVEGAYNVASGRESRAITGLSMGGLQSLSIGLSNPSKFAYIGGFSSAIMNGVDTHIAGLDFKKPDLKLLWIACGTDDRLITGNRSFITWARGKGLPVTAVETPGAHTWLVWRDNLLTFAPLLFRK